MTENPIERTTLSDQTLPSSPSVAHVEARRITIAPSVGLGAHVHNGPVFGTIEAGSAVFTIGDGPATILRPGDIFHEPADVVVSFDATAEGVTFLAYFLLGTGESPEIEFRTER
jgi:quercetin dioxygenase-like cupin family protein